MKYIRVLNAITISSLLLLMGCAVEPSPIAYGSDFCHFCRMTIVDKQHGAEIVTGKGKVYKFDAVECMLNHFNDTDNQSIALFLVNGYTQPGKLIDATGAYFLISEGIPSPMGAYLTAFSSEADALDAQKFHGGQVFTWQQIKNHFKN